MIKALCVSIFLASCAGVPPLDSKISSVCEEKKSFAKGKRDAESGLLPNLALYKSCDSQNKNLVIQAYRRGFDSVSNAASKGASDDLFVSEQKKTSWVCEIEANSKVFTGVGRSQEEAIRSAKDTCGSHLHSSSCGESECRSSL